MGTWTIEGIGSNTTGEFTLPANTGSVAVIYNVTYDDGDGGGGSSRISVPACSASELIENNISASIASIATGSSFVTINVASKYPVESEITCNGKFTYNYKNGGVTGSTKSSWSATIPINETSTSTTVSAPNVTNVTNYCFDSLSVNKDTTYKYTCYPTC